MVKTVQTQINCLKFVKKILKLLNALGKIRNQFYQYGFMEEELTLLHELRLILKKKEISTKVFKLKDNRYKHEFMREELTLLDAILILLKKKGNYSPQIQTRFPGKRTSISSSKNIKNIFTFYPK